MNSLVENRSIDFLAAGNIVVDGIASSSYVTLFASESAMHAAAGVLRLLYHCAPWLFRTAHALRIAQPAFVAIGRATEEVCAYQQSLDGYGMQLSSRYTCITMPGLVRLLPLPIQLPGIRRLCTRRRHA